MPITTQQKQWLSRLLTQLSPPKNSTRYRVVLDTNVLLDLLHWHDPSTQFLYEALHQQKISLLWSKETAYELVDVLQRSHFGWTTRQITQTIPKILSHGRYITDDQLLSARQILTVRCKDPLDQKFLEISLAGQANYLFTKDKLVLKSLKKLHRFGIRGGRPVDFSSCAFQ